MKISEVLDGFPNIYGRMSVFTNPDYKGFEQELEFFKTHHGAPQQDRPKRYLKKRKRSK